MFIRRRGAASGIIRQEERSHRGDTHHRCSNQPLPHHRQLIFSISLIPIPSRSGLLFPHLLISSAKSALCAFTPLSLRLLPLTTVSSLTLLLSPTSSNPNNRHHASGQYPPRHPFAAGSVLSLHPDRYSASTYSSSIHLCCLICQGLCSQCLSIDYYPAVRLRQHPRSVRGACLRGLR